MNLESKTEIAFVTAGGTIDKSYASGAGVYNFEIDAPAIGRILMTVNPNFQYSVSSVLKMDSLDMKMKHFRIMYDALCQSEYKKIGISMGTDRLVEMARALSKIDEKLERLREKTIAIFGASSPELFKNSDAPFNAGVAVGALHILPPGIYVCMSGRVYNIWNVRKDPENGKFVEN